MNVQTKFNELANLRVDGFVNYAKNIAWSAVCGSIMFNRKTLCAGPVEPILEV